MKEPNIVAERAFVTEAVKFDAMLILELRNI